MKLNITSGRKSRPVKCVIYGSEGIGKSTLAAQLPDPLFIDTEDGTGQLDVKRVDPPRDWQELLDTVDAVKDASPAVCKTLVIDTVDHAEQLCIDYVCKKYNQSSIEGFGYGKGYTYVADTFDNLLVHLDGVVSKGMNVVLIAHAKMRKFEQPDELGAYDRWEMKLSKNTLPYVKEWCDMLLFANYKTIVVNTQNGKAKAKGGERKIYTTHNACWDAKNRFGLPDEMPWDVQPLLEIFDATSTTPQEQLHQMMQKDGISEEAIMRCAIARGKQAPDVPLSQYDDDLITQWIIPNWQNIINYGGNQ